MTQIIQIDDQSYRPLKKPSFAISDSPDFNERSPLHVETPDDKKQTSRPESKESLQHQFDQNEEQIRTLSLRNVKLAAQYHQLSTKLQEVNAKIGDKLESPEVLTKR